MRTTLVRRHGAVLLALSAVIAGLLVACGGGEHAATRYHCPMHPTYVSDRPGDCPICGMRLVPIEEHVAPTTLPAYVCPMHPEVTSDKPGRCPTCGMKLVPVESVPTPSSTPAPAGDAQHGDVLFYRNPMDPSVTSPVPMKDSMGMDYVPVYADDTATAAVAVAGHATVDLSADGIALAGIKTVVAGEGRIARTIRAVGIVTPDETRIRHVHTKIAGWVERLFVNFTGQPVRAGEPILALYSPELLASQEELIRARETAARFATSSLPEVRKGGEELLAAARRRLALFDVPAGFISEVESSGKAQRTVTLDAPVSGFVTMKSVFEGQQIEPGMELFTITDLSRVWVEADFYEYEARTLRLGEKATVALPYDPGKQLQGRISYIYPTLDTETRTLKVRFEFPNPETSLKPGMFANIELQSEGVSGIVIPDSAILDTGERQVVFVALDDGRFAPRAVSVGVRANGMAQITSGLAAGDHVVVRATFLLDSESRLRSAIAEMGGGGAP